MTLKAEESRNTWISRWMSDASQDFRYSVRTLGRDLGFTTFVVLIIALGIGASSTVFSVLDTILIRPLPFKDPGSLVWIANEVKEEGDLSGQTVQVGRMQDLRKRNRSFSDIAGYFAFYGVGDSVLTTSGEPERLSTVPVSQNFFSLLEVQPLLGRYFSADECKFNGAAAVMMSYGLWVRRFASDPGIIGKIVRINDQDVTVVGVLPRSFDFGSIFAPGSHIDLYSAFPLTAETDRWGNTLALVGRLKHGVSIQQAQAEVTVLGDHISDEHPRQNSIHPKLTFLPQHVIGKLRPALFTLACAVGVVMLIVCANLSNLLLARTATRQQEMAVRTAIGAGRYRLIRQLLTESLVLTSGGAVLGLVLAVLATRGIAHLSAFNIPLLSSVRLNLVALGFTLAVAVAAGLVLGMAPALQVSALPLSASLAQRGGSESRGQMWMRGTLVVTEIALACILLVGAGLLIRSFLHVLDVNMGFRPESAATVRVDPDRRNAKQAQTNAYFDEVLRRVGSLSGVQAAGMTDALPLGHNRTWGSPAKGQVYVKPEDFPEAFVRIISDGYIKAMGMSLRKGRDFTQRDVPSSTQVIIVNQTMARNLWPGRDPIGQVIQGDCGADRQVVGVVADVRHIVLEKGSGNEMYIPIRQCQDYGNVDLVVRSTLPFPVLASNVEGALRPILPELPRGSVHPLTDLVDRAVSPRRFIVLLLGGFAGFALLLASLGIYGVISYSVNRRTQEIGIRMALGASTGTVQSRIMTQTLGLAALGMLLGAAASLALSRGLSGLLYGVTYGDPFTFFATSAILLAVAVLAGYLPARRASRIDPMIALRVS
ncbi:MAG: ABC transporter permease [Bryobacteraceae bacterium]